MKQHAIFSELRFLEKMFANVVYWMNTGQK